MPAFRSRVLSRLVLLLSALFCAGVLMFAPTQDAQEPASAASQSAHFELPKHTQACGLADLSCQEVSERDCSLPEATLSVVERPFLAHLSVPHSVAQAELAPPERPPRLRA